jgi:hypothetical protein
MPDEVASFDKRELDERFLLQVNYEWDTGLQDFMTSRTRIVRFERDGSVFRMLDASDDDARPRALAEIPIRGETPARISLDLNEGFDEIDREEDRTGEDYYGRVDTQDPRVRRLSDRKSLSVSRHGAMRVFDQQAKADNGEPIVVHYYLSPYRPDAEFRPFEMQDLDRIGFYQTYPQRRLGRTIMYATKFDVHEPIVFALSSAIPERYRVAVRDGVEYWNRALGIPLIRVVDAPAGVRAPSPRYNVVEWATSGSYASTSHIQIDPQTGQILHTHVFVLPETMLNGNLTDERDHLSYIVAHEIGHALGLRHNFAAGPEATVMNYFDLPDIMRIGRAIRAGETALEYDRQAMRHVYLGEPLDLAALPQFCTDDQRDCSPLRGPREPESLGG